MHLTLDIDWFIPTSNHIKKEKGLRKTWNEEKKHHEMNVSDCTIMNNSIDRKNENENTFFSPHREKDQ